MIWQVPVDLKQIHDLGCSFPWPRPDRCMRCHNWRVWGHGFVRRYFDGFTKALFLKCYRCPLCGCVITARPASHFPRIRSSRQTIYSHLRQRISRGRWLLSPLTRSRLRHWMANLKRQIMAHLTNLWDSGVLAGFEELLLRGQIPVARVS
jgi:hypothetical protein